MPRHNRQSQQNARISDRTASNNPSRESPSAPQQQQQQQQDTTTMKDESTTSSSLSLLQHLSHACQYHAAHHAKQGSHGSSETAAIPHPDDAIQDLPVRCRKDLITLSSILPKVEQATSQQQPSTAADILHLCAFYQDVMVGGYCPHAPHLFHWGKGGTEVLPRIYYLFQHLASRPILQNVLATATRVRTPDSTSSSSSSSSSSPPLEPVATTICHTIAQFLTFLPDDETVSKFVGQDLIDLCFDLSVISASGHFQILSPPPGKQQPLQVEILTQTIQAGQLLETNTEYLLPIPSHEMLLFLQAAVFSILQDYLNACRKKRLDDPIAIHGGGGVDGRDDTVQPVLDSVDACFYRVISDGEMINSLLSSIRQVLLSYDDSFLDRKMNVLSVKAKIAAGQMLLALLEDWEQLYGMPSAAMAMQVRLLVVQSVDAWFRFSSTVVVQSNYKRTKDNHIVFPTVLAHLLCHSILRAIPFQATLQQGLQDEGIIICTLLQCIPLWKLCGTLELVVLRSIHVGLVTTSRGDDDDCGSLLSEVVWSHGIAQGLIGPLFSLLHNSSKSIANATLWILDLLLASPQMVNMDRSCEMAWKRHQLAPIAEVGSHDLAAAAAAAASVTTTTTRTPDAGPSVIRVQDVANTSNTVPSPTGRKRKRTPTRAKKQDLQPVPLVLMASQAKQRSGGSRDDDEGGGSPSKPQGHNSSAPEGNSKAPSPGEYDDEDTYPCYSWNDALANFLFSALGTASRLLSVVKVFEIGELSEQHPDPPRLDESHHQELLSSLSMVSNSICLLINAMAKRFPSESETSKLESGYLLDVFVSLCGPMKEVCRVLLVEQSRVGERSLMAAVADAVSRIGLHAHFAFGQIQGNDSRLDLVRATLETFSCVSLRFWLAPSMPTADVEEKPVVEDQARSVLNLPEFCCGGLCQLLLDRISFQDASECCTKASRSNCLCANCFCYLLDSTGYDNAYHPTNCRKRFRWGCSLMLLQSLPLRTRCGLLVCLRPPQETFLSKAALTEVAHLAIADNRSPGCSFILDIIVTMLRSCSLSTSVIEEGTLVSVLSLAPLSILSSAFQISQTSTAVDRNLSGRLERLFATHIKEGLVPILRSRSSCEFATVENTQKVIYSHIGCLQSVVRLMSTNKGLNRLKGLLVDPEQLVLYLTNVTIHPEEDGIEEGSLVASGRSMIVRSLGQSLRKSILTLALLRPDNELGRLIALECVHMEGSLRSDLKECLASLASEQTGVTGSALLWMIRIPFIERVELHRMTAAREFGRVLAGNNFNLFYTIFATDEDWSVLNQTCDDELFAEEASNGRKERKAVAEKLTMQLFQEVDRLLHVQCAISQSYLSFTTPYSLAGEATVAGKNGDTDTQSREETASYRLSAILALSSLCQCRDVPSLCGVHIFEHALLRLIRLWMYTEPVGYDPHGDLQSCQGSMSALAFFEIARISIALPLLQSRLSENFIPTVFSDILSPSPGLAGQGIETIAPATRVRHCCLLKTFVENFLVTQDNVLLEEPMGSFQNLFRFVNDWLPSVLAQFVVTQDYECMCLATGFKLFLLGEKRRIEKQLNDVGLTTAGDGNNAPNPAAKVTIRELEEQTKLLCLAPGVIEQVLPAVFMRSERNVLVFLTRVVLKDKFTLKQIITSREKLILKNLVWEIGRDPDFVTSALRSLRTAAIARTQEAHSSVGVSSNAAEDATCVLSKWVTPHFMYLLVNVVQYKWKTRSNSERLQAIRSLREILAFLSSAESPQYFPQVMATVNSATALESNPKEDRVTAMRIRLVAVQVLIRFVEINVGQNWETVGANLTATVVALNPVLTDTPDLSCTEEETWCLNAAKGFAVQLLERLARGDLGKKLSPYFRDIPFLLTSQDLENVRTALRANGVNFDGLLPVESPEEVGRHRNDLGSNESGNCYDTSVTLQKQAALQGRLNMLLPLLTNENVSIRKAALEHLTDLIRTNRDLFHGIVENESRMSVLRFLTENYSSSLWAVANPVRVEGLGRGVVTEIVETLLSRCVNENDDEARLLIATCLGEVGAVGEHQLSDIDIAAALESDKWQTSRSSISRTDGKLRNKNRELVISTESSVTWRLSQPPWHSIAERYELQLLTKHLVIALKAAPTSVDQHMIAFTIQQLLVLLDKSARAGTSQEDFAVSDDTLSVEMYRESVVETQGKMSQWLTEKLFEAGVIEVIEPYWSSEFSEAEAFVAKQPPFFQSAVSFYMWLSNWCRYMVRRSKDRGRNSRWSEFFYACRTALRTQAGVPAAEFLLPLLVLDSVCFGDAEDERVVLQEMRDVLSVAPESSAMDKPERQRAVDAIFMVIDTLNYWSVRETEARYQSSRDAPQNSKLDNASPLSTWSVESSVLRIEDITRAIPLSVQARAAAEAGMHARSLRLLEMEARLLVVDRVFNVSADDEQETGGSRTVEGTVLSNVDRSLMKDVLGKLNDSDTLLVVTRETVGVGLSERARDSIRQKEATGDWLGALLEYERAQQLDGPDKRDQSLQQGALRCLMELGQFESVLNQVAHAGRPTEANREVVATTEHFVPVAIEAAWRLGRWSALADLVAMNNQGAHDHDDNESFFQAALGEAMLGLHTRSFGVVRNALTKARHATMKDLSTVAKESYDRAYSHLVKLHCLREIENASDVLCVGTSGRTFSRLSDVAEDKTRDGWDWERRLSLVSNDGSTAVINTRLALARFASDKALEGNLLLSLGKRARQRGLLSIAANSFAQAEAIFDRLDVKSSLSSVRMQLAKLVYASGDITAAMKLLGQDDYKLPTSVAGDCGSSALDDARFILKSTRWMVDGGLKGSGEIMRRFGIVQKISPDWEKGHFQFAKYVDSVMQSRIIALVSRSSQQFTPSMDDDAQRCAVILCDPTCQQYTLTAMQHYAKALALDSKHVYLALPRLLSLWFEFTGIQGKDVVDVDDLPQGNNKNVKKTDLMQLLYQRQSEANSIMATHHKVIPAQLFYAVIPQLVSRVIHPNEDTSLVVQRILKRVLTKFPATAMWPLAWLRQSRNADRLKIGEELFTGAQRNLISGGNSKMQRLLGASKSLFKYLLDLAKYAPSQQQGNSFTLVPWKGEVDLVDFIPPLQAALSICVNSGQDGRSRDFFPRHVPRMRCFASQVQCMASKARPKRLKAYAVPAAHQKSPRSESVTGRESNSRSQPGDIGEIHFLVKQEAKGDLRKDARVQDLNNVINRLMAMGTNNTRQRRGLHLRTFAVTCLSEDTGVIEWCRNTTSLRSLVTNAYNPQASPYSSRRRGRRAANLADTTLRSNFEERCQGAFFKNGKLTQAAALFDELCLKPYPPVLYWWFVENFQDPHAWYEARNRFALTSAVWSVAGHVAIALGDRHAENILLDTISGDCVHVDFDCIFDKGITLPKPEVVPFRLTQNMVDAFGPTGADGIFSGGLRAALTTLRNNRDTLLSVLEPFVKDPVIDWKKSRRNSGVDNNAAGRDAMQAKRALKVIDERLKGIYNLRNPNLRKIRRTDGGHDDQDDETSHFLPLSVEGQVHKMIAEATSSENLVQLYVGWMPWI